MEIAKRPRLKTIASSSESVAPTCAITGPDGWSKRDVKVREVELVQIEIFAAGAALIRDNVTSRVVFPQAIDMRVVPKPSANTASVPPVTAR